MSTFLQLSVELRVLTGVQGTGPTDVSTATGMELKLVNYIKNAWIDIQSHPKKWKWMWGPYYQSGTTPLQTAAATNDYVINSVDAVVIKSFKSYLTATGTTDRQRMTYRGYRKFENSYGVVSADDDRPLVATRLPNGKIRLHPQPSGIYSIEFDYYKTPQVLAVDGDIPEMPTEFHQLIVYEAMKRFGKAEDSPEVIAFGEQEAGSDGNEGIPVSGLWRSLIWSQEMKEVGGTDQSADNEMVVIPQ